MKKETNIPKNKSTNKPKNERISEEKKDEYMQSKYYSIEILMAITVYYIESTYLH